MKHTFLLSIMLTLYTSMPLMGMQPVRFPTLHRTDSQPVDIRKIIALQTLGTNIHNLLRENISSETRSQYGQNIIETAQRYPDDTLRFFDTTLKTNNIPAGTLMVDLLHNQIDTHQQNRYVQQAFSHKSMPILQHMVNKGIAIKDALSNAIPYLPSGDALMGCISATQALVDEGIEVNLTEEAENHIIATTRTLQPNNSYLIASIPSFFHQMRSHQEGRAVSVRENMPRWLSDDIVSLIHTYAHPNREENHNKKRRCD